MSCYLCGNPRQDYFGYFCVGCQKYQYLCNLYSPTLIHNLLDKILLVNESKLESKLQRQLNFSKND
jgi:hypothetical protein